MPERKQRLRILLFREGTTFDTAVRETADLNEVAADPSLPFASRLLVSEPALGSPDWLDFVEGVAGTPLPHLRNQFSGAVWLIKYRDRIWALTFGLGHTSLDTDRALSRFGLRTVLNVVDPKQLIAVGSRVQDDLVIRTNRQASKTAGREVFTIDDTRDIVGQVSGRPADTDAWGRMITGGQALSITATVTPASIPELLDRVFAAHAMDTYKANFAFVDFIEPIRDEELRRRLDEKLVRAVTGEDESDVYLAPPEVIPYDDVAGFLFLRERAGDEHPELELDDYRARVSEADVSPAMLGRHTIRLVSDATGVTKKEWSVYKCLVFETTLDDGTYLLSEGDWFSVAPDFVDRVNRDIGDIPIVDLNLPPANAGEKEAAWNARAAVSCGFALLDQREVRFGGTDVELADLLTPDRQWIHVKRKTQSATLSHLFNQGRVAAEALKVDAGVRAAGARKLRQLGRPEELLLSGRPFMAGEHTIVYAVIAKNAAELPAKLPFFSRLNLWHASRFLKATLDYGVAFARIPVIEP